MVVDPDDSVESTHKFFEQSTVGMRLDRTSQRDDPIGDRHIHPVRIHTQDTLHHILPYLVLDYVIWTAERPDNVSARYHPDQNSLVVHNGEALYTVAHHG